MIAQFMISREGDTAVAAGRATPAEIGESAAQQAVRFLRRAMLLFETDRVAAWRNLSIAASLLTPDSAEHQEAGEKAAPRYALSAWKAKRVLEHIESNLDSKVNIEDLAGLLALSKSYFARAFKQRLGASPMAFVAMRRVERAKALMTSTQEPLTSIALACGFGDQPHLTRCFRRFVGTTPGRYRRVVRQQTLPANLRQGGAETRPSIPLDRMP